MIGGMEAIETPVARYLPGEVVIAAVSREFDVSVDEMKGASRCQWASEPRQIAWMLLRKWTRWTVENIGDEFNRDHTTVLYGVRKAQRRVRETKPLRMMLETIEDSLMGVASNG